LRNLKDAAYVASKKEKLIEEAQKLALKGPVDKAIRAYEQLVAMEPAVLSHRQRLADLLLKAGRPDNARSEYEVIGKNYSGNGFYLKAIAVYTKLRGLFPGDIPIILTLAGLNEKHGLTANALAEYKHVYDYYEKNGEPEESLKILEKMQEVDPQNVTIRLKLAEGYFAAGKKDESYALFGKLATLLQERGDAAASGKLSARIQQLFPAKSGFMLEVLAEQVANGHAASAVKGLQDQLRTTPNDKRLWELMVEAYKQLQDPQRLKVAYQHYLKVFPDELSPKAGLALCVATERDLKGALELLDQHELALIAGKCLNELEGIYRILDEIDPINLRVLEGLGRVYAAAGKKAELEALEAKIKSLQKLSGGGKGKATPQPEAPAETEREPEAFVEPDYFSGQASDEPEFGEVTFAEVGSAETATQGHDADDRFSAPFDEGTEEEEFTVEIELEPEPEPEIEPEIEIDIVPDEVEPEVDWLDAAATLLDSLAPKGGKVKFASTLDGDDAQSHYDLGLAFMEMGLFDESFKEFRQAAAGSGRRFACYVFQGICLREKGDLANAEKVLRSLDYPGIPVEDSCTVRYELALTFQAGGNSEQYLALLADIEKSDRTFRDVHERLAAAHNSENFLDFNDDDLKGLDFK
jgi:tetratricopeptide (TPR) repeat protein